MDLSREGRIDIPMTNESPIDLRLHSFQSIEDKSLVERLEELELEHKRLTKAKYNESPLQKENQELLAQLKDISRRSMEEIQELQQTLKSLEESSEYKTDKKKSKEVSQRIPVVQEEIRVIKSKYEEQVNYHKELQGQLDYMCQSNQKPPHIEEQMHENTAKIKELEDRLLKTTEHYYKLEADLKQKPKRGSKKSKN